MNIMNITNEEIKNIEQTKSADEWNSVCDEIKRVRNNQHPQDWYQKIIESGLYKKVKSQW